MGSDGALAAEVLRQHDDEAGRRFDEALARSGLPAEQQRELRYWQRQSVEALRVYAAEAVPAALAAVQAARAESGAVVEQAVTAWTAVHGEQPTPAAPEPVEVAQSVPTPAGEPAPRIALRVAGDSPGDRLEARRRTVAARLASGS